MQGVVGYVFKGITYALAVAIWSCEVLIIEWIIRTTFTGSTPHFIQCAVMWLMLRLLFRVKKAATQQQRSLQKEIQDQLKNRKVSPSI